MIKNIYLFSLIFLLSTSTYSQNSLIINEDTLIKKFPEFVDKKDKLQKLTDEWKLKLNSFQQKIDSLSNIINNKKLDDSDILQVDNQIKSIKKIRNDYAKSIFEPNGEFDKSVKLIFNPIENKLIESINLQK